MKAPGREEKEFGISMVIYTGVAHWPSMKLKFCRLRYGRVKTKKKKLKN